MVRIVHWLNVPLLAVVALSGLQIFVAYPQMGPRGGLYTWFPLQGFAPPVWARAGGWLAGARALHFGVGLLLVLNAAVYGAYLAATGEWRRRLFFPRRDARDALQTAGHYLHLLPAPPKRGLYNGLQRLAYASALGLGVLAVLSGLALYKPVQLGWLAWLLGGYDVARVIHFASLVTLALFTVGHVVMVAFHPRSLLAMVTGGAPEPFDG